MLLMCLIGGGMALDALKMEVQGLSSTFSHHFTPTSEYSDIREAEALCQILEQGRDSLAPYLPRVEVVTWRDS